MDNTHKLIIKLWLDQPEDEKNKTEIGRKVGVSARTVGRVVNKLGGSYNVPNDTSEATINVNVSTTIDPCITIDPYVETVEDPKFLVTSKTIMIALNDEVHSVDSSHQSFESIKQAISERRFDDAIRMSDIITAIKKYASGHVVVTNAGVEYKGKMYSNDLTNRILDNMNNGVEPSVLVNFMNNVMENPSFRAANELFRFMQACSLPITEDGYFLAYKRVRSNYTDCHSGTFDNSVGAVVEMERNEVNDDMTETCSHGLHFCSKDYLATFYGDKIMVLKIHPRDVVSIPIDYGNAKGRCCKYEVVAEIDSGVEIPDFIVNQEWIDSLN